MYLTFLPSNYDLGLPFDWINENNLFRFNMSGLSFSTHQMIWQGKGSEREWVLKKIKEKDLGPRWGTVKTTIFENEPSLFCYRYYRWRAKYWNSRCWNRKIGGTRLDTSLVILMKNRETLRNSRYSVNQSQKTVLVRGLSGFLYWYKLKYQLLKSVTTELQIPACIQRFYLRAAISDCLLIGFIRTTETLRKNWNKQFDIWNWWK
jgi:hypothetical protein